MEGSREERLARNEVFFRGLNEQIRGAAARHGSDEHVYEFICECSYPACTQRVALTTAEYERIRAEGAQFVLAAGHDITEIESVVESSHGHVVVEKVGVAGEIAEALDPRAAV